MQHNHFLFTVRAKVLLMFCCIDVFIVVKHRVTTQNDTLMILVVTDAFYVCIYRIFISITVHMYNILCMNVGLCAKAVAVAKVKVHFSY